MNRFFIAGVLALAASSPAFAQDMPLSQILIDGEGWKKVEGPKPKGPEIANWPGRSTRRTTDPLCGRRQRPFGLSALRVDHSDNLASRASESVADTCATRKDVSAL